MTLQQISEVWLLSKKYLTPLLLSLGEMTKQMKVKKLKNLKTLDSKPGEDLMVLHLLVCSSI